MTIIYAPKLDLISHDDANRTSTFKVSYSLRQSAVERLMVGLRYREKIELREADAPESDGCLYAFTVSTFPGSRSNHIDRSRTVTLADDMLDEDGVFRPVDEVYAKICVSSPLVRAARKTSNPISHKF